MNGNFKCFWLLFVHCFGGCHISWPLLYKFMSWYCRSKVSTRLWDLAKNRTFGVACPHGKPLWQRFQYQKIVPLGVVAQELLQQQCVLCLGVGAFWRGGLGMLGVRGLGVGLWHFCCTSVALRSSFAQRSNGCQALLPIFWKIQQLETHLAKQFCEERFGETTSGNTSCQTLFAFY